MRVLVVKTSSMGDVIHTLPALTDAMRAIPGIQFDWVVEEGFAEIPGWHPAVDQVIPVAIRRWRKQLLKTWRNGEWQQYKARLRIHKYDYVIDAQGLLKSAFLVTRLARGKRVGLDKDSAREPLASWFYDQSINISKNMHAVERTRKLFAGALGYTLPEEKGEYCIRDSFIAGEIDADKYLVFLHSTTRFDKHWPEVYWKQLIGLATEAGWKICLPWGNSEEKTRAERLADGIAGVEVLPKLNLKQVTEVLAGAEACVSVDTGLSHMAAALDRPNITLFGPTDPGLVGGYGKQQLSLESRNYSNGDQTVEPEIFASLTADVVWHELQNNLAANV